MATYRAHRRWIRDRPARTASTAPNVGSGRQPASRAAAASHAHGVSEACQGG